MRVLTLTADYLPHPWSGIGTAVAGQCQALSDLGVEVHMLAPAWAGGEPGVARGVQCHRLGAGRCPVDPARFDVVHLHSLSLAELALEICRRYQLPLVYTAHSLLWEELREVSGAAFWVRVQEQILACAERVVFLTAADREAALARLPGLAGRSAVIPNGIGPAPAAALSRPRSAGPVVFAGRFTRQKGVPLLDALVRELLPTHALQFVFAGGHGDDAGERLIAGLVADFPQACRQTGWLRREALDDLLGRAALVLMPSEYEPFGLLALEAMRVGAPVLARAVGGLREVAGPGSGGMLVHSNRAADWREATLRILGDAALRARLSRQGPRWVAERYQPGPLAARLLEDVYRLCVQGSFPAGGRRLKSRLEGLRPFARLRGRGAGRPNGRRAAAGIHVRAKKPNALRAREQAAQAELGSRIVGGVE
jgi:glycosyltransferase involved in cell wall biosynthesis